MPRARVGDVEIEYEVFGRGEPLLLIQGFAAPMIMWDEQLCRLLVDRGFQVIRYDNRDVGASSILEHHGEPDALRHLVQAYTRRSVKAPYDLYDMAGDGIGLLDALGIERAHVVGASMGGMIVQCMAIRHGHRLKSATSIMSTTGARWASIPSPSALRAMLKPPPRDRRAAAKQFVDFFRQVRGPRFTFNEERLYEIGEKVHAGVHLGGAKRQLSAIAATGDRTAELRGVEVPFLVIHGTHDPLVPVWAGYATHRALRRAKLKLIHGMGHELPLGAWPLLVSAIHRHAREHGFESEVAAAVG